MQSSSVCGVRIVSASVFITSAASISQGSSPSVVNDERCVSEVTYLPFSWLPILCLGWYIKMSLQFTVGVGVGQPQLQGLCRTHWGTWAALGLLCFKGERVLGRERTMLHQFYRCFWFPLTAFRLVARWKPCFASKSHPEKSKHMKCFLCLFPAWILPIPSAHPCEFSQQAYVCMFGGVEGWSSEPEL